MAVVALLWSALLTFAFTPGVAEEGTSLTLRGDLNTYTRYYTAADGVFGATQNQYRGVTVTFSGKGFSWEFQLSAPFEAPLRPGIYSGATHFPFGNFERSGFVVYPGSSSDPVVDFEVKKVVYGPGKTIIAFWATFEQHPDGSEYPPLEGEIKFNADAAGPATNQPPAAYAGPDLRVMMNEPVPLIGGCDDDSLPASESLVSFWSVGFGPGEVTFSNPDAPVTSASFSTPGEYLLHLTVYDGEFYWSDHVRVTVLDPELDSYLVMTSPRGEYVGDGKHYDYTQFDGEFSAYRNYFNGVSVTFRNREHEWNLDFAAVGKTLLTEGVYEDALRFPFNGPNHHGINVSGDGRAYNSQTGRFEIKEIIYGLNGEIVSFLANFEQRGERQTGSLRGEIRYNAPEELRPSVRIEPVGAVASGRPVILKGKAIGLGAGGPVKSNWTQLAGPKPVLFGERDSPETSAVFPVPGTYRLLLTASDGASTAQGEVTLIVSSRPAQFAGIFRGNEMSGTGLVKLSLTKTGRFTGNVRIKGQIFTFQGEFDVNDRAGVLATSSGGGALLDLQLRRTAEGTVVATLTSGTSNSEATLEHLGQPGGLAAAYQGQYACTFGPTEQSPTIPTGDGWGILQIKPNGMVRLSGTLADGTPFSHGTTMTERGRVPFSVILPRRAGEVTGEMTVRGDATRPYIAGRVSWQKQVNSGVYPEGFLTDLELTGERMMAVDRKREALTRSGSKVGAWLTYGDATRRQVGNGVMIYPGGAVTAESKVDGLSFKIAPDGVFRGKFTDRLTGLPATFSGIVLGSKQTGIGFYLSGGKSGFVRLQAAVSE